MKGILIALVMALFSLGPQFSALGEEKMEPVKVDPADSAFTSIWLDMLPRLKYELFEEEMIPLNLVHCTAENIENKYVILNWKESITNTPSQVYEIQKYNYDKGWETIQRINSAEKAIGDYSFLDRNPVRGHSFYRIVQYDQVGNVFGSEVLPVSLYDPLEYSFDYDVMTGQAVLESGRGDLLSKELLVFKASGEQVQEGVEVKRLDDQLHIRFDSELTGMYLIKSGSFITQVFRPDFSSIKR